MKNVTDVGYTAIELTCDECPKKEKCETKDDYHYQVIDCLRKKLTRK